MPKVVRARTIRAELRDVAGLLREALGGLRDLEHLAAEAIAGETEEDTATAFTGPWNTTCNSKDVTHWKAQTARKVSLTCKNQSPAEGCSVSWFVLNGTKQIHTSQVGPGKSDTFEADAATEAYVDCDGTGGGTCKGELVEN
jgi:hypothetical protein